MTKFKKVTCSTCESSFFISSDIEAEKVEKILTELLKETKERKRRYCKFSLEFNPQRKELVIRAEKRDSEEREFFREPILIIG